jgi:hypothetical protein
MTSVTPGHSESTVNGDPMTRVPQPRVPTHDTDAPALNPIAQARVRESAARNSAAVQLFENGRHDEAVPLFEQALTSCRSTLGSDHPDTLIVAGNLAVAYVAAGNRRKGIKLIAGNLAARVRVFGDDPPRRSPHATPWPSRTGSTATSTPRSSWRSRSRCSGAGRWGPSTPTPSPHAWGSRWRWRRPVT